jgi:hypothetical protein
VTEEFRFALPPGTTAFHLPVHGQASVSLEGQVLQSHSAEYRLDEPASGGAIVRVDVHHDGSASGGGLFSGPVEVTSSTAGPMPLGDWSGLGLRDWSGGVRYRTTVQGPVDVGCLDLGAVRGTAELRVNGRAAGCRVWSPYAFDVGGLFDQDQNVVEVDVYNTLAPYVGAVSPTPWVLPGQSVSGLLGPVTLYAARPGADSSHLTTTQGER